MARSAAKEEMHGRVLSARSIRFACIKTECDCWITTIAWREEAESFYFLLLLFWMVFGLQLLGRLLRWLFNDLT